MLTNYVSVDLEMSGLSPVKDRIIEIAALRMENGTVTERFETLVNPNIPIREHITEITGIREDMLHQSPGIDEVMPDFIEFLGNDVLLGHSVGFDFSFIMQSCYDLGLEEVFEREWYGMDTLLIARKYMEAETEKNLDKLCKYYGIKEKEHHRAGSDAEAAARLYEKLCNIYERNVEFQPVRLNYKPKKQTMIAAKQVRFLEKLVRYHGLEQNTDFSKLTQREGSRMADMIIAKYGKIRH
ncbi:MAG: 3'-5' exonuclease [Lachnospiraceae bacterium]|nr:3'-5' exonuclease [Lachnospiraceae bacterium]